MEEEGLVTGTPKLSTAPDPCNEITSVNMTSRKEPSLKICWHRLRLMQEVDALIKLDKTGMKSRRAIYQYLEGRMKDLHKEHPDKEGYEGWADGRDMGRKIETAFYSLVKNATRKEFQANQRDAFWLVGSASIDCELAFAANCREEMVSNLVPAKAFSDALREFKSLQGKPPPWNVMRETEFVIDENNDGGSQASSIQRSNSAGVVPQVMQSTEETGNQNRKTQQVAKRRKSKLEIVISSDLEAGEESFGIGDMEMKEEMMSVQKQCTEAFSRLIRACPVKEAAADKTAKALLDHIPVLTKGIFMGDHKESSLDPLTATIYGIECGKLSTCNILNALFTRYIVLSILSGSLPHEADEFLSLHSHHENYLRKEEPSLLPLCYITHLHATERAIKDGSVLERLSPCIEEFLTVFLTQLGPVLQLLLSTPDEEATVEWQERARSIIRSMLKLRCRMELGREEYQFDLPRWADCFSQYTMRTESLDHEDGVETSGKVSLVLSPMVMVHRPVREQKLLHLAKKKVKWQNWQRISEAYVLLM